jgi:predicted transcriptional regulator
MAAKMTSSLDADTANRLRTTARRLRKSQSQVVREAIAEYRARADRLFACAGLSRGRVCSVVVATAATVDRLRA